MICRLGPILVMLLVAGGVFAPQPVRAQSTPVSREDAQRVLAQAFDGSRFQAGGAPPGTIGSYGSRPSQPCRTLYRLAIPAYAGPAGKLEKAIDNVYAIDWTEVLRVSVDPDGRLRVERRSATEWFNLKEVRRRDAFIAASRVLIPGCAGTAPVRQPYHREFVRFGNGSYRCTLHDPYYLKITVYPDGKVWAHYENKVSLKSGHTSLEVSLYRYPDGRSELTDLRVELDKDDIRETSALDSASLYLDGIEVSGFSAGINSSQRNNGPIEYYVSINLNSGGPALLERLEKAREISVKLVKETDLDNGIVETRTITSPVYNDGLAKVRPWLKRSNWNCLDRATTQ